MRGTSTVTHHLLFPSPSINLSMTWQPSASLESLKARAELNRYLREFFAMRDVLEVETPILSQAGVSDPFLNPVQGQCMGKPVYLHTSPEYPMKRLLAAGSGDIYQICKVFRDDEAGSRHNPEFSMLEYYRLGFSMMTLMDEVAQLVGDFLQIQPRFDLTYQQALERYADVDPFTATDAELQAAANQCMGAAMTLDRDGCLDILMTHKVEPYLPHNALVFIHGYPQSQAALARVYENAQGHPVAKRFELYVNGLELANGYDELCDADEQRHRFDQDLTKQAQITGQQRPVDNHFLASLTHGMPDCAGVALGLDRILMLKLGAAAISEVVAFTHDHS